MSEKLQTIHSVARKLGLPTAWVKRECVAGRLPCIRVGKSLFADVDIVRKAIEDRMVSEAEQRKVQE